MNKFWMVLLVSAMALGSVTADAKRLGGGKSIGKQSNNVTQQGSAPPAAAPGAPAQSSAAAAPGAAAAGPAAAAATKRPWGAMLGGLAAGLGLAWLASSLGLGAGFAQFLMIALLAVVVFVVVGMVMRSRRPVGNPGNLAFQGAAAGSAPSQPATPQQYRPEHVGNDASARPWERSSMAFDAGTYQAQGGAGGVVIGSALSGAQSWGIPAGFDAEGFLSAAKRNFVTLQDAWDRADVSTLRSMMTDSMLDEIKSQLAERESHLGGLPNKTDVVMIDARLLGIEDLGEAYMASVEFSGMIREQPSAGPSPFREVWNMTKPRTGGSGWLVAGVQALQ